MKRNNSVYVQWTPAKIVFIYLFLCSFWLLLSDKMIEFVEDKNTLNLLQTYKGWFYAFLTGLVLYALIQSGIRRTREIEAARIASGKRYDELVENANDCIFTLDSEGNFTAVNRAVERITGYPREEILKLNFADLLAPENRDYIVQLLNPKNTQNPLSVNEVKIIGKDGRTAFLEISSHPLSLKDKITTIENIARDVTHRHLIQVALQEVKLGNERLIETANEGIWTVDADFRVTSINPKMCELIGYDAEDVLGKSLPDLLDEDLRKESEERILQRRAGAREQSDFQFTRPDGKQIWLFVSSNPIISNGEFKGALYMATDITLRKNAEKKLRESEERFRILFNRSAVGSVILSQQGQVLDCNEIAAEILGYTEEELKKLTVFDFDALYTPEEIIEINERAAERDGRVQFETLHRTKSGEIKNVLVAAAHLQIEGRQYGFASFIDITDKKRAEEELRREKARFEKIATVSPSVIHTFRFTHDNKPFYPYSSPAIYEIYGKTPEELEKPEQNIQELTHPDDIPLLDASLKKSAETMSVCHDLWRVNNPQKGEIWVEGYAAPVLEADGSITWYGIMNDVTERVQREKKLAERERMLTAINNAAPNVIMLWNLRTYKTLYINESVRSLLGYTPEEMYAMSPEELFSKFHPEDLPTSLGFVKDVIEAGDGEILTNEYRFHTKSNEWRLMRSRNTVFERDANGKAVTTLSIVDDITERRFAIEALRKSEERLRKLHRIVSNLDLNYSKRINQLLKLGVQEFGLESAVLGEVKDQIYRIVEAVSPADYIQSGFVCGLNETLCEEVLEKNELLVIEHIGATPWREHLAYATFKAEVFIGIPVRSFGKVYGTLCFTSKTPHTIPFSSGDCEFLKLMAQGIGAELTRQTAEEALRKSEEKLRQSQKLESVGRLAGGIAHDFNNMLTAINGYSDLTLSRMDKTNPLRHNIEEIKRAGERSSALTQQLLAFSRKQILNPKVLNINQTVSEIGNLLERLIGEDISLIKILSSEVKLVEIDPGQLSQVIVNLAVNARDVMPNGGTITIKTKNVYLDEDFASTNPGGKTGEFVMLSVSDTGIGMSEETMQQIFEPFFTTKEVGKGTGLGLATVYGFIKQSDGYITVESKLGEGTIFKIFLPCTEEILEKAREESSKEHSEHGAETILLVEDEEMVRNLTKDILESCGYQVIEAAGGMEALEICEKNDLHIDLLLTDVVMPQMNGRELLEKLAANRPRIKVLFTSGYTDDMVVPRGVKNDEINFLQKPFSIDALMRKVREILDTEDPSND